MQTETPQSGMTHPPLGPTPIEAIRFTSIPFGDGKKKKKKKKIKLFYSFILSFFFFF